MFGKKQVKTACDNFCRAQALREAALFNAAKHGPRF